MPVLVPLTLADRAIVSNAIGRYGQLYIALADRFLGIKKLGGGITQAGFEAMMNGVTFQRIRGTGRPAGDSRERPGLGRRQIR